MHCAEQTTSATGWTIAVQSSLGDLILSRPPSFTFPRPRRPRPSKPPATHPRPLLVGPTRHGRLGSLSRIQMAVKWYVSGLETTAAASGPCDPEPTAAPSSAPSLPHRPIAKKTPDQIKYTVVAPVRPRTARSDDQTALPTRHVSNRGHAVAGEQ